MDATLTEALELHRAGRYADAARRYHDLLSREPENADALHLFGVSSTNSVTAPKLLTPKSAVVAFETNQVRMLPRRRTWGFNLAA